MIYKKSWKYILIKDNSYWCWCEGYKFFRIKSLKDFSNVSKGDLGGYVYGYRNLSQTGDCWIYDIAWVFNNATVSENAKIMGSAQVFGHAKVTDNAIISERAKVRGDSTIIGGSKVVSGSNVIIEGFFT